MNENNKNKAEKGEWRKICRDIYSIREVVKVFKIDSYNDGCCNLYI